MREILFRGKDKDDGKWKYGLFVKGIDYLEQKEMAVIMPQDLMFFPRCEVSEYYEVFPETIGQYTGIKDRYGQMIFEGDILESQAFGFKGVATFCKGTFDAGIYEYSGWVIDEDGEVDHRSLLEEAKDYMVIGNIYDNKEELED